MFTPMNEDKTKRLSFKDSEVKVLFGEINNRELGLKAIVEIKGIAYKIFGIACDLPRCYFDVKIYSA